MSNFKIVNPTFGSDPEFLIVDIKTQQPRSVVGLLGGTKEEPAVLSKERKLFVQEDNVMAELTMEPSHDPQEIVRAIAFGKKYINEKLKSQGLECKAASSAIYPEPELAHPNAQKFGCSISYNAYTQDDYPSPCAEDTNIRSAGFHVHVGFKYTEANKATLDDCFNFIKYMDTYLGVPSIIYDTDDQRRKLYGRPGDCRYKIVPENNLIILEYRTLGGFFGSKIKIMNWVFKNTQNAIKAFNSNVPLPAEKLVQDIILTNNIDEAKKIASQYDLCKGFPEETEAKVIQMQTA